MAINMNNFSTVNTIKEENFPEKKGSSKDFNK